MSFFDKNELEEILASGEFSRLIGKYENELFDCKRQPYALDTEKGKHELAKDVSAFANIEGGYILLGAKGEDDQSHSGEQIKTISAFEETLVSIEQNRNIIDDRIFPNVRDVEIKWYSSKDDETKGLILIKIPPQQESDKPFLNKKIFNNERNKISETVFGFFQRRGDKIAHYELKDFHRLIQLGWNYQKNITSRFDALESKFNALIDNSPKEDTLKKKLDERIISTLKKTDQFEEPTLVLSGIIVGNQKIKDFNFSGEIVSLAEKSTQPFREGGWKLLYSTNQITNSLGLIELGYNSKSLSIFDDGGVVYISNIDQITMINNSIQIIPIAMIEVILGFTELYEKFIQLIEGDFNIIIKVQLNNLKGNDAEVFTSWNLNSFQNYDFHTAPENSFEFEIEKDKNFTAGSLAFEIVRNIYYWFGIKELPPYSKNENGIYIIDINQIPK